MSSLAALPSNIRVFVTFKEDTIFAGEDVEATITFRNVELSTPRNASFLPKMHMTPSSRQTSVASQKASQQAPSRPPIARQASVAAQVQRTRPTVTASHRPTHSLTVLDGAARQSFAASPALGVTRIDPVARTNDHGRSISIVSLGSDTSGTKARGTPPQRWFNNSPRPDKPTRSESLQVAVQGAVHRVSPSQGSTKSPSPLSSTILNPWDPPLRPAPKHLRRTSETVASLARSPGLLHSRKTSESLPQNFRFPGSTPVPRHSRVDSMDSIASHATITPVRPRFPSPPSPRPASPRINNSISNFSKDRPPLNRIYSLNTAEGTPRSSTELYSQSNHSNETLMSDYAQQPSSSRLLKRPFDFSGRPQQPRLSNGRSQPETLMMGYAQIMGSFTVDASLVNQAPFEDVKRRAVVGGQSGGGVVGIERPKAQSGLFGSLGWNSIGESLGSLLGGSEMSSINEMKAVAVSKDVPLLSTPKSILFVDLKLAPGESRSYSYTFTMPRGLPPSHKGRAMKVSYSLVIGTQRSQNSSASKQQMRQVEVPFRLFGGVNIRGEALGHDLMSPYIILRDQATTSIVGDTLVKTTRPIPNQSLRQILNSTETEFSSYINKLLSHPRRNSSSGLLSPTAISEDVISSRNIPSAFPLPPTRALIDDAIRRSTQPIPFTSNTNIENSSRTNSPAPTTSQTQFTIARASHPIAHLTLARPALRLGDVLHLSLEFPFSAIAPPVYALEISLESAESVDAWLAIRSASSVERATRRVWDRRVIGGLGTIPEGPQRGFGNGFQRQDGGKSGAMALGWCKRWAGSLKVPVSATPGFITSGVGCKWAVRVEIVVGKSSQDSSVTAQEPDDTGNDSEVSSVCESDGSVPSSTEHTQRVPWKAPRASMAKPARAMLLLEEAISSSNTTHERLQTPAASLNAQRYLPCETFEVVVPLRVFGALGAGLDVGIKEDQGEGLPI